jgi:hypothetical protein
MVHLDKTGLFLICPDCGGTCPRDEDKYDDVMHLPGCIRRARLDVWAKHPAIQRLMSSAYGCKENVIDLNAQMFSRTCPAARELLSILDSKMSPEIGCSMVRQCYAVYFEQHEEEVLEIAEAFE